jgi:cell division septation protein DedD
MAKRKQPRRQGSKGTPAWAWLLVGLFVGALVFIGYRQYLSISAEPAEIPVPKGAAASGGNGDETASEPEASSEQDGVLDTDYSFYDVLPTEENTDIPADPQPSAESATDAATTGVQTPVAEAAPASDTSRYLLQAGAFERAADADDLKARIALSGEAARVESAEVNGRTLYRVRLGPYADSAAANAAKANLAGQGIKADSIKIGP